MTMQLLAPEKRTTMTMSYDEFLAWADEDTHAEWVQGEVIHFMPAKPGHQITMKFLADLITYFVQLLNLGEVFVAPLEMKLPFSSREPDIMFLSKQNRHLLTQDRLNGAADLVVEIVSRDSVTRDRRDKFKEYRKAGVAEYWVIDSRIGKERADFYVLDDAGDYDLFGTEDDEKVYSAVLEGFWLKPEWLWRARTIDPFRAFCEMRGLSEEQTALIRQMLLGND